MRTILAGLLTLDVIQVVQRLPRSNEKLIAEELVTSYGGPAANAAGACAALGISATLISMAGQSPQADLVRAELLGDHIDLIDTMADREYVLPVSSVLVESISGDRAVVSTNASLVRSTDALPLVWPGDVDSCLVDGHNMSLCTAVAAMAKRNGVPVVFDGGSWKAGTEDLLRSVDFAVVSDDFEPPSRGDVLEFLAWAGCPCAAQTHGFGPIELLVGGARTTVRVPEVTVVDTLGAGDTLHGALAAAVAALGVRALDRAQDAIEFAAGVASMSCAHRGARGWVQDSRALDGVRKELTGLQNSIT